MIKVYLLSILVATSMALTGCDKDKNENEKDTKTSQETDAYKSTTQETDIQTSREADVGASSYSATGTVTSVDKEKGKVAIAHDPVPSLNWPAMTMPFDVNDKSKLEKIDEGDKVEFSFVPGDAGKYIVQDMSEQ